MDSFPTPPGGPNGYGAPRRPEPMRTGRLWGDLSLARQGVEVAVGFGVRSLEGLVDVAELLERSVYEPRSLRKAPEGFGFTLLNPPLRMGAFRSICLFWNGAAVDGDRVTLTLPDATARSLASIGPMAPVTLPVGERCRYLVRADPVPPGRQHVRLELQSIAVPPKVWFEFADDLAEGEAIA